MRRRIALLAVLAAVVLLITVYVKRNTFSYTNLVDEADRIQARVLLEEAGISRENIDGLFSLIEAFYQDPYPHLAEQGLQRALIPLFSYRDQDAFDHFDRQPDSSLTCRMAAFLLLKDSIRFPDVLPTAPEEKDPMSQRCLAAEQDRLRYNLLFANVEGQAVRSSEDLATGVQSMAPMAERFRTSTPLWRFPRGRRSGCWRSMTPSTPTSSPVSPGRRSWCATCGAGFWGVPMPLSFRAASASG